MIDINITTTPTTIPTLQEVLDNNHDLLAGINIQGTGAGLNQTGNNVNIQGASAGANQTGSNVNIQGESAGQNQTGINVNIWGREAGVGNTFNNVNLLGEFAQATRNGQTVLSKDGVTMARIDTQQMTDSRQYDLPDFSGTFALINITDDFANDTQASTGGVPIGRLYHTAGVVKIRLV